MTDRFKKQMEFLIEIDKAKSIIRRTRTFHEKKYENDAEHSWHMCCMILILQEYANESVDIFKVIKMALIHDLVEIYSGDTFLYAANNEDKYASEQKSAQKIFGLLPDDQRDEYAGLWEEFEKKESTEARFAGALDRLGPIMQNHFDNGHAWQKHSISSDQVLSVNRQIDKGSHTIWEYAQTIIAESIDKGHLK